MARSSSANPSSAGSSSAQNAQTKKPLVDLSDNEMRRIVDKTGVLRRAAEADESEPHLLVAVLIAPALLILDAALDYIVHDQYGFTNDYTADHVLRRELPMLPAVIILLYATSLVKHWRIVQLVMAAGASAAGSYLVHITTTNETFGTMLKAPGLAVVWIALIIQMDIPHAIGSLVVPFVYAQKDTVVALFNSARNFSSFTIKEDL